MPTTYTIADEEVRELLAAVVHKNHRDLHEAGVIWGVLMALNPGGIAVSHGGYPAAATVRIVPLKDRVTKHYDAEIVIDLRWWETHRRKHQLALLDHEVRHVALAKKLGRDVESDTLQFTRDDIGRPKLRLVKGDWNAGDGFADVCERHGEWAVEFENLSQCYSLAKAAAHGEADGPSGHPNREEGKESDL